MSSDDPIRSRQHVRRYGQTNLLRRFQIDEQLKLCRLLRPSRCPAHCERDSKRGRAKAFSDLSRELQMFGQNARMFVSAFDHDLCSLSRSAWTMKVP
jgi:hypothetical protein